MADPNAKFYTIDGKRFTKGPEGTYKPAEAPTAPASIADGTKVKFEAPQVPYEAPQVPYKVPGHEAIMNRPVSPTREEMFGKAPTTQQQAAMFGSLVGGAASGGLGMAPGIMAGIRSALMSGAGAGTGDYIAQQFASPEERAANPENFGLGAALETGAMDAGINSIFGSGAKIASKIPGMVKSAWDAGTVRGLFNDMAFRSKAVIPKDYEGKVRDMYKPADRAAINEGMDQGVKFTVGQVTGKAELENLLARDSKILATQAAREQNKATIKSLLPTKSRAELGEEGVTTTLKTKEALSNAEGAAHTKVSEIAKTVIGNSAPARVEKVPGIVTQMDASGFPVRVPGMIEQEIPAATVEGPIYLFRTNDLATKASEMLSGKLELVKEIPELSLELKNAIATLDAVANQQVVGYEAAKEARTKLGAALKGTFGSLVNTNEIRILQNLRAELTKDMGDSIDKLWPSGSLTAWKRANTLTERRTNIATPGMNERVQGSTRADAVPESFFEGAFENASTAKLVRRNAGPAVTQQAFVRQFYDKFADNLGGNYKGGQALEAWGKEANQEVAKAVMPGEARKAFEYFLRRAAILESDPSHMGQLSVAGAEINAALGTAKGAAAIPTKITDLFNMSSGKFIAIMSGRQFAEKILTNPAKAREATRLITTQAGRPGGDSAAWKFITAANLGEIIIRNTNGEEVVHNTETGETFKP